MAYTASQDPGITGAVSWDNNFRRSVAITPNDSTDLSGSYPVRLRVISAGTLSYTPAMNADGDYVTTQSLPAGYVLDVMVRRVRSTGTTATVVGEHHA